MASWQKKAAKLAASVPRLEYKPSPGLYSRLERAASELPANVKVPSLLNSLRRYPEGVPGWEVDAVGLADAFSGRHTVPRQDVVDLVREKSPVFTMRQARLHRPPAAPTTPDPWAGLADEGALGLVQVESADAAAAHGNSAPLGSASVQGEPLYERFGANRRADDYTELLLLDKTQEGLFHPHWDKYPGAAAHMRMGTNDDALRIYEMQSDRVNQALKQGGPAYVKLMRYPLKDSYDSILSKLALIEAAKRGHRAVEVVNPASVDYMSDASGKHRYGSVVPGALEKAAKPAGGLVPDGDNPIELLTDSDVADSYRQLSRQLVDESETLKEAMQGLMALHPDAFYRPNTLDDAVDNLMSFARSHRRGNPWSPRSGREWRRAFVRSEDPERFLTDFLETEDMPLLWQLAEQAVASEDAMNRHRDSVHGNMNRGSSAYAGRRWLLPDETRRRIITQGLGAAVAAPIAAGSQQQQQPRLLDGLRN